MSNDEVTREVIGRIRNWITEEGLTHSIVEDPASRFNIMVRLVQDFSLHIVVPAGITRSVYVVFQASLSDTQKRVLGGFDAEQRRDFIFDVSLELCRMDLPFRLEHPNDVLESIRFEKPVYYDSLAEDLAKHMLFNAIFTVLRAYYLVNWMLARFMTQAPRSEQAPEISPVTSTSSITAPIINTPSITLNVAPQVNVAPHMTQIQSQSQTQYNIQSIDDIIARLQTKPILEETREQLGRILRDCDKEVKGRRDRKQIMEYVLQVGVLSFEVANELMQFLANIGIH